MSFLLQVPQSTRPKETGVALVLVLWMLTLLTVIAQNLAFSSRTDIIAGTNLASQAQAEAYADAVVYRAVYQLANNASSSTRTRDPTLWKADGLERPWSFGDADVRVTIISEAGKISLNAAPPELLAGLFASVGLDQSGAGALADAVLDWRDADDLRHLNGAEKADYLAAGLPHRPSNVNFVAIEELQQVMGMTPTLFRLIEQFVTVHNSQAGIDSVTAPRGVLLAIPSVTPSEVDQFILQRQGLLEQGLPVSPFGPAQVFGANPDGATFSIHVAVQLGDNTRFYRQAVVRLTGSPNDPVGYLAWRAPSNQSTDRTVPTVP